MITMRYYNVARLLYPNNRAIQYVWLCLGMLLLNQMEINHNFNYGMSYKLNKSSKNVEIKNSNFMII